jgi:hypothetical protein
VANGGGTAYGSERIPSASFSASLAEGATRVGYDEFAAGRPRDNFLFARDTTITLPLVHASDEVFPLAIVLSAKAQYGSARERVTLTFSGLPDGARVESCQGFGTTATPVRRSSWGALKQRYR